MESRHTPGELWELYVGNQSPAEFCSHPGTLAEYVQSIPDIFPDYDPETDPDLETIEAGLAAYIVEAERALAMSTQTIAQTVSALLHDDGQVWKADDGRDLDTLAFDHGANHEMRTEHRGGTGYDIYSFTDGSRIIAAEGGWDLGFTGCDCTCWAEVGHLDDCPCADENILALVATALDGGEFSNDWAYKIDEALTAVGVEQGTTPDGSDPYEIVRLADGRMIIKVGDVDNTVAFREA